MATYAYIQDSINEVINIIEWDGVTDYDVEAGYRILQNDNAWIGAAYDPETNTIEDKPE